MLPLTPGASVYIVPQPILLESPARVCLMYDPGKPVTSGSMMSIELYLCDAAGADLASIAVGLRATGIAPAGSVNPTGDFQFDPSQASAGAYTFSFSTSGLAAGKYTLQFTTVTDDSVLDSIVYAAAFEVI